MTKRTNFVKNMEGIETQVPRPKQERVRIRGRGRDAFSRRAIAGLEYRYAKATPKSGIVCGGRTYVGDPCQLPAGWGTSHFGQGRCRLHGGSPPVKRAKGPAARRAELEKSLTTRQKEEIKEDLDQILGYAVEIDPLNALLWCIRITAGEVQYWTRKMTDGQIRDDNRGKSNSLFVDTIGGPQLNPVAKQRQQAVDRLAKYSQIAITTGLAERAVRLAEAYGELLANLLYNVVQDLEASLPRDLRPEFRRRAEVVIPARLYELEDMPNPDQTEPTVPVSRAGRPREDVIDVDAAIG
jgi:hypothetical protein